MQTLQEAGAQKHRRYLRQKRDENEFAQQLVETEFSDYCDTAKAFPRSALGDDAFYKHLASRENFLKASRVVNILLQRVSGDVEKLPWDMKLALQRRGEESQTGIDLELSNLYLSKNQLFKMTRIMRNITSINFTNCIFDGSKIACLILTYAGQINLQQCSYLKLNLCKFLVTFCL